MKICVIDLQKEKSPFYRKGIKTLADVLKSRGFDVVCATEPDTRDILSAGLIVVCASRPSSFSTKLDPQCKVLLSRIKGLTGRRSYALLLGSGLFTDKAVINLMNVMESEGMKVINSGYAGKMADLERIGTTLKIPVS